MHGRGWNRIPAPLPIELAAIAMFLDGETPAVSVYPYSESETASAKFYRRHARGALQNPPVFGRSARVSHGNVWGKKSNV